MKLHLLGGLMALALAGCAVTAAAPERALAPQARYVSMGSSFAAGAGIGPVKPGTPERCSRTTNNYATLLASRMDLSLTDVGCNGATTDHILGVWNELPAQIDAVTPDTRLVTITIGGNDLGYVGWLFSGSCRLGVSMFPGPCRPAAEPGEADYRKLDQKLRAIAGEVHARAPQARLVFVQYVALISPTLCPLETITPEDAAVARRIGERLAQVTRDAASASGAEVLAMDSASQGHTPCAPVPWSNGLDKDYDPAKGAPWHPNAAGHAAIADGLVGMLSSAS